jgi:hypothetical protein
MSEKTTKPESADQPATTETPEAPVAGAAEAEAKGVLVRVEHDGATYVLDRAALDDVDLIERIGDFAEGRYSILPSIVRTLLGREQWNAFKEAHRAADGRIPTEAMDTLYTALNKALGE